jgi:hypothetical protein
VDYPNPGTRRKNVRKPAWYFFQKTETCITLYFECDLGDGWEDAEVHNDPVAVREKVRSGANIISYIFKFSLFC